MVGVLGRLAAVAITALAACYSATPPAGAPCAADGACPTEQMCNAASVCVPIGGPGDPDAPPSTDGAPGDPDRDGDGINNLADNCPDIANVDQGNEDGDELGDACDPCPPFADTTPPADPDGDGVSGACDPSPGTPGDRIALFEGFHGTAIPQGWVALGDWSVAGGTAQLAVANATSYLTLELPHATRMTVSGEIAIDDLATDNIRAIGLAQLYQPQPSRSIVCELLRNNANNAQLVLLDTALNLNFAQTASPLAAGQRTTFTVHRDGSDYACSDGNSAVTGTRDYTTANPSVGIRARNVAVRVGWLLVVTSP